MLSGLVWAVVIVGLWFIGAVLSKRRPRGVPDRPDLPYSPFTREFDLTLPSDAVQRQLAADGVEGEAPRGSEMEDLGARVARFDVATAEAAVRLAGLDRQLDGQAILFLLDLSGSMVRRLPDVLGELRAIHSWLTARDANCSILGFTTRGWRGGLARQKWQVAGRPPYPGRLCALMHIEIAAFGRITSEEDWNALLRPDVLRENVDGEAIRWGAGVLGKEPATTRRLFVLSDGAPVDDSTLSENGPNYLWRDLTDAIGEVESAGEIELVGVGLSHRVDALYRRSAYVNDHAHLTATLMPIILQDQTYEQNRDGQK